MGDDQADVSLGELAREIRLLRTTVSDDFAEVKHDIRTLRGEMLSRDVFEARHSALKDHFDGEVRRVESKADEAIIVAQGARSIGLWAIGLLSTAVLASVALVLTEIIRH